MPYLADLKTIKNKQIKKQFYNNEDSTIFVVFNNDKIKQENSKFNSTF